MIKLKQPVCRIKKFIYFYLKRIFSSKSKNVFIQFKEILYLIYKIKYLPHNYYKFNGYLKGVDVDDVVDYMPGVLFDAIKEAVINDSNYEVLVKDKYLFSRFLHLNNLPCTEVLGVYIPSVGIVDADYKKVNQEEFFDNLTSDFVIKPTSESAQGEGVKVIKLDEITNKSSFLNYLKINIKNESLIEKKIAQHEALDKIHADSINTVRVDTLIKTNGDVLIGNSVLRVGRNGRKVDNWSGNEGGIAIPIDLETGKLKESGRDYFFNSYFQHPNSGVCFKEYTLPYFDDILSLVKKAALLFPKIRSLGWDVSITHAGPVIIEANHDYGARLIQVAGPMFKNSEFIASIKEYVYSCDKGRKYRKYFK